MSSTDVLDAIIPAVSVELFHSLGIAAAPMPPAPGPARVEIPELVALGTFSAPGCVGSLYIGCPPGVVQLAQEALDAVLPPEDWIRELTNQLMGRVKRRFLQFGVAVETGLPALTNSSALKQLDGRTYSFRTLRGTIVVILDAEIDRQRLVYRDDVKLRAEGDIILF